MDPSCPRPSPSRDLSRGIALRIARNEEIKPAGICVAAPATGALRNETPARITVHCVMFLFVYNRLTSVCYGNKMALGLPQIGRL